MMTDTSNLFIPDGYTECLEGDLLRNYSFILRDMERCTDKGQPFAIRNNLPEYRRHFDNSLEYLTDLAPVKGDPDVLIIGSELGTLASIILNDSASIDMVEQSLVKNKISQIRNNSDKVRLFTGSLYDVADNLKNEYDVIFINAEALSPDMPLSDVVSDAYKRLKSGGRLLLAVNNRLGFQYLAGYREEEGEVFTTGSSSGLNRTDYEGINNIRLQIGIENSIIYFPFPNYRYCYMLYSEDVTPKPGELKTLSPFTDVPGSMLIPHYITVLDRIIENKMFNQMSGSYILTGEKS